MKKVYIVILIAYILNGCGFHLRGSKTNYKFPFQTVYVDCGWIVICPNLKNAIKTQELATLVDNPESAVAIIKLTSEQTSRDPQIFNSAGRIAGFLLTYQATLQVFEHNEQVGNDLTASSQATMQYNDSTILANSQNEVLFWDQLHDNVTNQLIRRLTFFKYKNEE